MSGALDGLAEGVAALGLPGTRDGPPRDATGRDGLVDRLRHDRLTGLGLRALEQGSLLLDEGQIDDLLAAHRDAMARALDHERALVVVGDALVDAGVEPVVLKGPAFAHTFYPDPAQRPFGDLDLLVRTRDWRAACATLEDLGFRRTRPEPRPGFDEQFGKAATHRDARGVAVDLHRTLVIGPFGLWIDPEDLFRHTTPLELGGRRFRRLDATASFVHACMHASLGQWPMELLALRDVAQLAAGEVDWERAAALTERWHLTVVVRHALASASDTLGWEPPVGARPLREAAAGRIQRWALAAYHGAARDGGGPGLAVLAALPGIRAKLEYARILLLPDQRFLDARAEEGGPGSYLRRWWGALRRVAGVVRRL